MSMCREHLRDKNLSLKAKGLLSQMLALPPGWNYTISGLVYINKENETAIKNILSELKDRGYLVVSKTNSSESGRFEYVYNIYESPQGILPEVENPPMDNPPMDNRPLNLIEIKDKEIKENIDVNIFKERRREKYQRFVPPTVEEVDAYIKEMGYTFSAETFVDFYSSKGWKVGSQPMKDWKAACRTWQRRRDEEKKTSPQKPARNSSFDVEEFFQASLLK